MKEVMGIALPVTSKQNVLFDCFVPSFAATVDNSVSYRVYLGYDDDDPFYINPDKRKTVVNQINDMWCGLNASIIEVCMPKMLLCGWWNLLASIAYQDGCDYHWFAGDDLILMTENWPSKIISHWESSKLGAAAFNDISFPTFSTFPVYTRTHMEIFGGKAFLPEFEAYNQECDPWIFDIYERSVMTDVKLNNTIGGRGQSRYNKFHVPNYKELVQTGREIVRRWQNECK